jgi:hypothetical protein
VIHRRQRPLSFSLPLFLVPTKKYKNVLIFPLACPRCSYSVGSCEYLHY